LASASSTASKPSSAKRWTESAAKKFLCPLQPREIWEQTAHWDKVDVLFKLKGAGDRDLALGPTHEEAVTPLVTSFIRSYRDLPRAVYQIQTKFRNEPRARSGLLRGREFRMKDIIPFMSTRPRSTNFTKKRLWVTKISIVAAA
jgi:prolyl-tRNA synthetase